MPDTWEDAMGLNKNDASDAGLIVDDSTKSYNGYSNIEVYANSLLWRMGRIFNKAYCYKY